MEDWRLTNQQEYLYKKKFKYCNILNIPNKDHEHCEFCWAKIGKYDDCIQNAYADENFYYWICQKCFDDFKELFKLDIV